MADHSGMKLGKKAVRHDPRTMKLTAYANLDDYFPPTEVDYTEGVTDWGVMRNNDLGDCTIAAIGHLIQQWTMNDVINLPGMVTVPDETVVSYYSKWAGYDPNDPFSDNGAVELDILNHWRKEGFATHAILGYGAVDQHKTKQVLYGIDQFRGLYIGLELPISAQTQKIWDVVPDDGEVWGGHAVAVMGYSIPDATFTCITWGQVKQMTWAFWTKYCSEAYALLGVDAQGGISRGPEGFDVAVWQQDLKAITA